MQAPALGRTRRDPWIKPATPASRPMPLPVRSGRQIELLLAPAVEIPVEVGALFNMKVTGAVLPSCGSEAGDVGVGILPQSEKFFVCFAARGEVAGDPGSACETQVRQHGRRSDGIGSAGAPERSRVIDYLRNSAAASAARPLFR